MRESLSHVGVEVLEVKDSGALILFAYLQTYCKNKERTLLFIKLVSYICMNENVIVSIPIKDRNLLSEIVRKFGWACM